MSEQAKKLVPKLRFPEFKNAKEWEETELGDKDISAFVKERIPLDQLTPQSYVSTENLLPDYAGVTRASKLPQAGSFTRYIKGDILVSNIRPYLKKVWTATNQGGTSNDVIVIRAKSKVKDSFLAYLLRNDAFIEYVMKGAKGVKMPRGDISLIKEYPLAIPADPKEQKKIADCLSTIDELITAQTQKIAALKDHKKGLMQQLFPAEGEAVPKRRFPEFQDAGDWEEKTLGDICDYWNGGSNEGAITEDGEYYLISLNSIDIDGNLKSDMKRLSEIDNSLQKNDLVMVLSDVAHGNFLGLTDIIPNNKFVLNQRMAGLRLKNANAGNVVFLRAYINRKQNYFKQKGQGSSQQNLAKSSVTDFPVLFPSSDEQNKIADCLSSFDELITAQIQQFESYKTHKKGLMQQLFPTVDEVA